MAIEYLLVTFPEQRAVLADGNGVGFTNHTLMLPTGTSLVNPMVICFPLTGAGAAVTATPPPSAPAGAPPGRRGSGKKKNA